MGYATPFQTATIRTRRIGVTSDTPPETYGPSKLSGSNRRVGWLPDDAPRRTDHDRTHGVMSDQVSSGPIGTDPIRPRTGSPIDQNVPTYGLVNPTSTRTCGRLTGAPGGRGR